MASSEANKARAARAKATRAQAAARVEDLAQVKLDGAYMPGQICAYVRDREKEEGSPWFLQPQESPLSDSQIRRYGQQADELIAQMREPSRRRRLNRQLAIRKNLYARAIQSGEIATALAVVKDECALLGLYPSPADSLAREIEDLKKTLARLEKNDAVDSNTKARSAEDSRTSRSASAEGNRATGKATG